MTFVVITLSCILYAAFPDIGLAGPFESVNSWALGFDGPYTVGFKWRRTFDGRWPDLEPQRGEYRWSAMDRIISEAGSAGQKVLWVFETIPAWSVQDEPPVEVPYDPGHAIQLLPTNLNDLISFLEAFWDRYAATDVIGAIEVWNEPNAPHVRTFPVNFEKYVKLTRTIYEVTRRRAPKVAVVGVSMSAGWHEWWLRGVFSRGVLRWLDAVSFHTYAVLADSHPDRPGLSLPGLIKAIRSVMGEYGVLKPLWITEAGVGLVARENGVILSQEEVNARHEAYGLRPMQPWLLKNGSWRNVSEQRGATLVVRGTVQSLAYGVTQVDWYKYSAREHSWFWDARTPTLQVKAHEVLVALLAPGAEFTGKTEALSLGDGTDLYIYWFRRPTDALAVIWRQLRTSRAWPMLWAPPLRPASVMVPLPPLTRTARALSMLDAPVAAIVSGQTAAITVGEEPVYLLTMTGP